MKKIFSVVCACLVMGANAKDFDFLRAFSFEHV